MRVMVVALALIVIAMSLVSKHWSTRARDLEAPAAVGRELCTVLRDGGLGDRVAHDPDTAHLAAICAPLLDEGAR